MGDVGDEGLGQGAGAAQAAGEVVDGVDQAPDLARGAPSTRLRSEGARWARSEAIRRSGDSEVRITSHTKPSPISDSTPGPASPTPKNESCRSRRRPPDLIRPPLPPVRPGELAALDHEAERRPAIVPVEEDRARRGRHSGGRGQVPLDIADAELQTLVEQRVQTLREIAIEAGLIQN